MSDTIPIHTSILNKLESFATTKKTPNILFHGPSGGGKKKQFWLILLTNYIMEIKSKFENS